MSSLRTSLPAGPRPELRHLRAPKPIRFPVDAEWGVTSDHDAIRTSLYLLLRRAVDDAHPS
jgi:hypothetical protein